MTTSIIHPVIANPHLYPRTDGDDIHIAKPDCVTDLRSPWPAGEERSLKDLHMSLGGIVIIIRLQMCCAEKKRLDYR